MTQGPIIIRRDELEKVFKDADFLRKMEKVIILAAQTTPEVVEAILGAAQPVRHAENFQNLDWIRFAENPKVANYARTMRWNEASRTMEFVTGLGNIIQISQELWGPVVNKSGVTLVDGKVVYASGVQGQRITVDYADARDGAKVSLIGVVTASIADNAEGPVTVFGLVRDLNTSAWPDGTKLYVAADATGTLTSTAPAAPNFRIWVATVTYQHLTQGSIFVDPRIDFADGVTLEDLHIRETLTSGDIANDDYFELEATGFQEFHGDARNFDDVYPSAVSIGRGANAPSITAYTGNFEAPEFPGSPPQKEVTLHSQIYHSYDEETDISQHLHIYIPDDVAGGTIRFYCEYQWANIGDTGSYSSTTISVDVVRAANAGIEQNYYADFPDIAGTGKKISSIVSAFVYRNPSDVADTFAGSVWLLSADCHIHKNTAGSRQETVK